MPSGRLGIFGGTFDPFHIGHLVAAQDVREALGLDRVVFVPAGRPPHKDPDAPPSLRLRMLRETVEDEPGFGVSGVEARREGPSYTVDTLRAFHEAEPESRFFLLMGADQWRDFGTWREPAEIARLASLVLVTREGEKPRDIDPGVPGGTPSFTEVPVVRVDISSSDLRQRVKDGRSIRYLVPEPVRRIIEAAKLYV